jgi:RNA polymerase sigma-70 factor (ECF subfamily)
MKRNKTDFLPTRASLLQRLRSWEDHTSWREFFNVYWRLIYGVARKAGLSDDEAQEVVQETLIAVAKHIPTFQYNPALGSFRSWLLNMTRWRIIAQFRKRQPMAEHRPPAKASSARTATAEAVPDPNGQTFGAVWDEEWEANLLEAAMDNVKRRLDPEKYQIFDFYVKKEWPPEKVAERFGVSTNQVYQIKHRVTEVIKEEVQRLEKGLA